MKVEILVIAALMLALGIQRRMFARKICKKEAEIARLESGVTALRQKENLPDTVWDEAGNMYKRLYGEFGNDEFRKCG